MFTVLKDNLYEKLNIGTRFTLNRISSIPALQNGLLMISSDKLEIITTNLNEFYYSKLKIQSKIEKNVVVDIKKIAEFLSFIQPGKIELSLESDKLIIKTNKTTGSFMTASPSDFPKLPIIDGKKYQLKKTVVKEVLPLVIFASATDDSRPILSGVYFCNKEDSFFIVATDGFRLSLYSENKSDGQFPQCILPARILGEIARLYKDDDVTLEFSDSEKMVKFMLMEATIYSRTIDGEFPPFQKVIPTSFKTKATFDKNELIRNIKLASVFARETSNIIIFQLKRDGVYIAPRAKETDGTVIYQAGEFEGEEQSIAFNYKYVLDFLNNIEAKKIIFEMTEKNAPGVFKSDKEDGFLHVIMPVRTDEV